MVSVHKFVTAQCICLGLFRKESRNLGFSVIIDVRKSATKRKYLESIVDAMVCFQVCIKKSVEKLSSLLPSKGHYPRYRIECLFTIRRKQENSREAKGMLFTRSLNVELGKIVQK